MKNALFALAMLVSAVQPALALDTDFGNINGGTTSFDTPSIPQPDVSMPTDFDGSQDRVRGDVIVGGIIGGVVGGLITAEIMDRDHRHYPPSYGRRFVCYAENRRGEIFRAKGDRPRWTQERAMEKCYDWSRFCRPLGCETRGW